MQKLFQALVLAAGKSSRFKTERTKLSYTMCGQEMIVAVLKALHECALPITVIVGYQKEIVQEIITKKGEYPINFVEQQEQKGTGHAVLASRPTWHADNIVILNGDMPLVDAAIIDALIKQHLEHNADISLATAHCPDIHHHYGRIIEEQGRIAIVEARDFNGDIHHSYPINAGIYVIKRSILETLLPQVAPQQPSGEIYLTEVIRLASMQQKKIITHDVAYEVVHGVNTLQELASVEQKKRWQLLEQFMKDGVRFIMPETIYLEYDIAIGSGTVIEPGACLMNGTRIGKNCTIGAYSYIRATHIAANVVILPHSVLYDATIQTGAQVGPFAHLRNQATIGQESVIGNFVEVAKSTVGKKTKAKHLSYLGNATIGNEVNIGAGTITCNYNGFIKQQTVIEDRASIGAVNTLIAPVTIGHDAMTAAHSCITATVPAQALAIARSRQVTKEHGAANYRARQEALHAVHFKAATIADIPCEE